MPVQDTSEKGQVNGYAPLNNIGVVPIEHLPTDVFTDSDLATHQAAADPHAVYQKESEKGLPSGYAGLDAGGLVPVAQLPASFFGWSSAASLTLPTSQGVLYTVPATKSAAVVFLSVKNTTAVTQTVDILVRRSGELSALSVGTVALGEQEYAWYVDGTNSSLWALSEGDTIEGLSTTVSSSYCLILIQENG